MYRSSFRCVEQNLKWSVQSFLKTGMKPAGPHFLRTHTVSCSCTLRIRKMPRGSLISGEWVLHKTYILQKLIQRRKYAFVLFVFTTIVVFVTIIIRIFFFFLHCQLVVFQVWLLCPVSGHEGTPSCRFLPSEIDREQRREFFTAMWASLLLFFFLSRIITWVEVRSPCWRSDKHVRSVQPRVRVLHRWCPFSCFFFFCPWSNRLRHLFLLFQPNRLQTWTGYPRVSMTTRTGAESCSNKTSASSWNGCWTLWMRVMIKRSSTLSLTDDIASWKWQFTR